MPITMRPAKRRALRGKRMPVTCIIPHLRNFGWEHSPDEYFRRQFRFEHQFLDREVMDMVRQLRQRGMLCCLATDQEKRRAEYLLETMNFRGIFQACFISCFIGARKCHAGFWTHVITELGQRLGIQPNQAAFFDDIPTNVAAAASFGIRACVFETVAKFRADMAVLGLDLQDNQPPTGR